MCGRYLLISPVEAMRRFFDVGGLLNLPPRYNIAPTQEAPVVRLDQQGRRELILMRWGLVPLWAKDLSMGARCINARAESVARKPAFRDAFQHRRCLVPTDGFFEWEKKGKVRQPWRISPAEGGLMALAGLWERWRAPDGGVVRTYAIITTEANEAIAPLHDRMPAVLPPEEFEEWLDAGTPGERLLGMLRPYPAARTNAYPVSPRVNNVRNDDPGCIEPLATGQLRLV
ncbi:MAG TPA: SOS response-associated peptidase [Alphaproteobacteria bacterium]|nr:SOS response-associated peptidase [Alphaproteobacteria bacterium]